MAKKPKKSVVEEPSVDVGPKKMTVHDVLCQIQECITDGIKSGSTVSLRKASSLVNELIKGQTPDMPPDDEDK